MDTTTQQDVMTYGELIETVNQISLEGFGDNLRATMDKTFPRLLVSLKDTFRSMTTWNYARPEMVHPQAIKARLRAVNYLDIDEVMVPLPNGLGTTLPEYVNYLNDYVLPTMVELKTKILPGLKTGLGRFINEPELFQESRLPKIVDMRIELRASAIEKESTYIKGGNRISDRPFGEAFQSTTDVSLTFDKLNKLNQLRWKDANPKDVQLLVKQIGELSTEVLKSIDGMEGTPRKEPMHEVMFMITEAAHWVSWFGIVSARIVETTAATKMMEAKLLRSL